MNVNKPFFCTDSLYQHSRDKCNNRWCCVCDWQWKSERGRNLTSCAASLQFYVLERAIKCYPTQPFPFSQMSKSFSSPTSCISCLATSSLQVDLLMSQAAFPHLTFCQVALITSFKSRNGMHHSVRVHFFGLSTQPITLLSLISHLSSISGPSQKPLAQTPLAVWHAYVAVIFWSQLILLV